MTRTNKITAVATALLLLAAGAHADEGMWVLKELNKQNIARMQELGLNVPFETLYSETPTTIAATAPSRSSAA